MVADFRRLLGALVENQVDFLVVGGLAANLHGSPRFTQDVDVLYRRAPENHARMVAALSGLSPYLRGAPRGLPFRWDEATIRSGLNFTLTTSAGDIDFLGEIAGGGRYEDLAGTSQAKQIFDISLRCLSLPDLIRTKRAAGRPKDLETIAILEALLEESGESPP